LGSFLAQLVLFRVILDRHVSEGTHFIGWFAFAMVIALVARFLKRRRRSSS
jgi:hypothetical protein